MGGFSSFVQIFNPSPPRASKAQKELSCYTGNNKLKFLFLFLYNNSVFLLSHDSVPVESICVSAQNQKDGVLVHQRVSYADKPRRERQQRATPLTLASISIDVFLRVPSNMNNAIIHICGW